MTAAPPSRSIPVGVEAAVTVEMPVCQGAGKVVDRTVQSRGLSRVGTMGQPAFLGRSADHVAGQQLNLPQLLVFVQHRLQHQHRVPPTSEGSTAIFVCSTPHPE